MDYLLDTHVCIWAIAEQEKLSLLVKDILQNSENRFWLSKMSLFEIAIKLKIGKLPDFNISFSEFLNAVIKTGFQVLDLKDEHLESYVIIDFDDSPRPF